VDALSQKNKEGFGNGGRLTTNGLMTYGSNKLCALYIAHFGYLKEVCALFGRKSFTVDDQFTALPPMEQTQEVEKFWPGDIHVKTRLHCVALLCLCRSIMRRSIMLMDSHFRRPLCSCTTNAWLFQLECH